MQAEKISWQFHRPNVLLNKNLTWQRGKWRNNNLLSVQNMSQDPSFLWINYIVGYSWYSTYCSFRVDACWAYFSTNSKASFICWYRKSSWVLVEFIWLSTSFNSESNGFTRYFLVLVLEMPLRGPQVELGHGPHACHRFGPWTPAFNLGGNGFWSLSSHEKLSQSKFKNRTKYKTIATFNENHHSISSWWNARQWPCNWVYMGHLIWIPVLSSKCQSF